MARQHHSKAKATAPLLHLSTASQATTSTIHSTNSQGSKDIKTQTLRTTLMLHKELKANVVSWGPLEVAWLVVTLAIRWVVTAF